MFQKSERVITPVDSLYFTSAFHRSVQHSKTNTTTVKFIKEKLFSNVATCT
jgi:hypothetical protein